MKTSFGIIVTLAALIGNSSCFAPSHSFRVQKSMAVVPANPFENAQGTSYIANNYPLVIQRQRHSISQVQTMGLFGLGGPEIAVILIAGAFLLGPQKLAELGKEAGKMAGELKEVPKEFQQGLVEGEKEAQRMKKEIADSIKDAEKE